MFVSVLYISLSRVQPTFTATDNCSVPSRDLVHHVADLVWHEVDELEHLTKQGIFDIITRSVSIIKALNSESEGPKKLEPLNSSGRSISCMTDMETDGGLLTSTKPGVQATADIEDYHGLLVPVPRTPSASFLTSCDPSAQQDKCCGYNPPSGFDIHLNSVLYEPGIDTQLYHQAITPPGAADTESLPPPFFLSFSEPCCDRRYELSFEHDTDSCSRMSWERFLESDTEMCPGASCDLLLVAAAQSRSEGFSGSLPASTGDPGNYPSPSLDRSGGHSPLNTAHAIHPDPATNISPSLPATGPRTGDSPHSDLTDPEPHQPLTTLDAGNSAATNDLEIDGLSDSTVSSHTEWRRIRSVKSNPTKQQHVDRVQKASKRLWKRSMKSPKRDWKWVTL